MTARDFWLTVLAVIVAQLAGGAVAYLATRGIRGGRDRGTVQASG